MYGVTMFYLSKLALELPLYFLLPLLELILTFWGIGYRHGSFGKMLLVELLMVQSGTALGYLVSGSCDSFTKAVVATPIAIMPATSFGGFFANLSQMSPYISWL